MIYKKRIIKLDVNERFIEACATGDFDTVNTVLDTIKDFNIDVTDNLGRTALRLAVANEHIEVFIDKIYSSLFNKLI